MTTLEDADEQSVVITFCVDRMSWTVNEQLGVSEPGIPNPSRRHALERLIGAQLKQSGKGYCDGGGGGANGYADIFLYGPDAEALWADIEGLVRPLLDGSDAEITIRAGGHPDSPVRIVNID